MGSEHHSKVKATVRVKPILNISEDKLSYCFLQNWADNLADSISRVSFQKIGQVLQSKYRVTLYRFHLDIPAFILHPYRLPNLPSSPASVSH